jgi:hypothetical protein
MIKIVGLMTELMVKRGEMVQREKMEKKVKKEKMMI